MWLLLLRRGVVLHNMFDLLLVRLAVFLEQIVSFGLRGRIWVRVVQQILDSKKDLLDCDGWLPSFVLVQDR